MNTWILVDTSYLFHRARYAMPDLSHEDQGTAIIYGFWEQLMSVCKKFESSKFALFFDSRKSYRSKDFPDYKSNRRKGAKEEEVQAIVEMKRQVQKLKRSLPEVGIPVYSQVGLESDDLIAEAAHRLTEQSQRAVIVTADSDLYQCLTNYVSWWDPRKDVVMTPPKFKEKFGIPVHLWSVVKALAGDPADSIPGIPGVGQKTAIKYLNQDLPEHYKAFQAIESEEGKSILDRNLDLIQLPHKKTRPVNLRCARVDFDSFFKQAEDFGFSSYLDEKGKQRIKNFFNDARPKGRKR